MLRGSEKQPASAHHVTRGRSGQIRCMLSAGSPKIQQLPLLIRNVIVKRCSVSQKIQNWTQTDALMHSELAEEESPPKHDRGDFSITSG